MRTPHDTEQSENINASQGTSGRGGNKIRTYCMFKDEFCVEKYCSMVLPNVADQHYVNLDVAQHLFELNLGGMKVYIQKEEYVLFVIPIASLLLTLWSLLQGCLRFYWCNALIILCRNIEEIELQLFNKIARKSLLISFFMI